MKSPRVEWPTFDSMKSCSGATGISIDRLKKAKEDGCPAFHSNRIYFADLLPWLFKGEGEDGLEPQILTWSDKLDKQKYEERAGILIEFEEAMRMVRETFTPIRQFILSASASLCARCNPSDPQHAREALDNWTKQGLTMLAEAERKKVKLE